MSISRLKAVVKLFQNMFICVNVFVMNFKLLDSKLRKLHRCAVHIHFFHNCSTYFARHSPLWVSWVYCSDQTWLLLFGLAGNNHRLANVCRIDAAFTRSLWMKQPPGVYAEHPIMGENNFQCTYRFKKKIKTFRLKCWICFLSGSHKK